MICPRDRCRLYDRKEDREGRTVKRSCYYGPPAGCPIAALDLLIRIGREVWRR